MIDKQFEDLMWEKIDGAIDEKDEGRLAAYLKKHSAARKHYRELEEFSKLFVSVGEVEPPPALRRRIVESLDHARPEWTAPDRPGIRESIRAFFSPHGLGRYAAVAAAGMFIGIIGYHLVAYNRPLDVSKIPGTMGDNGTGALSIKFDQVKGGIEFWRDERFVVTDVDLVSAGAVDVFLGYPGRPAELRTGDLESNASILEDGTVRLQSAGSGRFRVVFVLDRPQAPLDVRVAMQGNVLLEDTVYPEEK